MNELNRLFIEELQTDFGRDIIYRNQQLKRQLQKRYPKLIFIKNRNINSCELVLSELRHVSKVIQDGSSTEMSDTDMEDEVDKCEQLQTQRRLNSQVASRDLYRAAKYLRSVIGDIPNRRGPWPPTASSLDDEAIKSFVPYQVFNFLAWCMSVAEDVVLDDYVETDPGTKGKLFSIGQDIIYLASNGRKETPKHLALGMAIRHNSGSSKLVGLLNGFGHSVSHSKILEYDTALAERQILIADGLPPELDKKVPTTLAWDNNDFGEETRTGAGTTHNTNGIAIQRKVDTNTPLHHSVSEVNLIKSHKRTVGTPEKDIHPYFSNRKEGPPRTFARQDIEPNLREEKDAQIADKAYIVSKMSESETPLPGWTGFNTLLQSSRIPLPSTIAYLPVIDASPTEMSTVNTILRKSIKIADQLDLKTIVLVFDQAIYYKAQQIRWKDINLQSRLVVRLGQFHTAKTFLAVLGKRFKDAGLSDILVESGTVAVGSIASVMDGNHYNRDMQSHKLMYEALQRLCLSEFLSKSPEETVHKFNSLANSLYSAFPSQQYQEIITSEGFQNFTSEYNE